MGKPAVTTPVATAAANRARRTGGFQYTPNRRIVNQRPGVKFPAFKPKLPTATSAAYNRKWLEKADAEKKPFEEEVMNTTFGKENVEKLVAACKAATESEVSESNRLLNDDYVYSVQITSHRVPHVPVHLSRISLPHSIETTDSDVCLFVKDLKRGRRLDYEPTIKHYEQLLRNKKVDRSITIIPINQLYNDYATFELRRKLTYLFDKFLVDKSVATHVNGFLGHKLLMKGRSAIPVDLAADNLVDEIEQTLRKVFYKHINNGITQNVQVGRHSMSDEQIGENVVELVRQLAIVHPGGSQNVYKLHIKPNVNISVAVPLYVDLAKPEIPVPTEKGPKEKALDAAGTAADSTLENFNISKSGEVLEKVRQGKSIVADNVVVSDDDDDEMTGVQSTPVKAAPAAAGNKAGQKKGKQPVATTNEAALNDLILKNLKKLVPALKGAAANQAGNNSGAINKPTRNNNNNNSGQRPVRAQNNAGGNNGPNNSGGGGGNANNNRQQGNNQGGGGGNNQNRRNNAGGNQNRNFNNSGSGGMNSGFGGNMNSRPMGNVGGGMGGGRGYGMGFGNNSGLGGNNWGNNSGSNGFNNDPWGSNNRF